MLCTDVPLLTVCIKRRAKTGGDAFDHVHAFVMLRANDTGNATFNDPSLFASDLRQRIAQKLLMVQIHGRNYRHRWFIDHIRCIQTPAQSNLEQRIVGRRFSERQQTSNGGDFKIGNRVCAIGLIATV